jgi:GTP cyclohydrolase III
MGTYTRKQSGLQPGCEMTQVISIVNPTRCTNFSNLLFFWGGDNTLHVSDGLSIHRQEFKTVHTATGIHHAGLLVSKQTAVPV